MSKKSRGASAAKAVAGTGKLAPARQMAVTTDQVKDALGACLMVLDGAEPAKILQMTDKLQLGKLLLRQVVSGQIAIGQPAAPVQAAAPTAEPAAKS